MPCRHGADGQPVQLQRLAGGDLTHLPGDGRVIPDGGAQPEGDNDGRATGQRRQRTPVEVIRMPMRDDDDVDIEIGWIGNGPMPRKRPEASPQERVGQDADPVDLDERGRVPQEADPDALVRRPRLRRAA